jgi:membrane associated rhomboid family serine protease
VKGLKAKMKNWSEAMQVSFWCVAILFFAHLLNFMMQMRLLQFGIVPRTTGGLWGILFSPFLHANAAHLFANASAMVALVFFLFANKKYRAEEALLWIWLLSGIGTWLIGRGAPAVHVGASGVIYGLIAYLFVAGFWMKGWRPVLVAVAVLILYGGAIYGMVPTKSGMSWEGHLSGALAGISVAGHFHQ